MRAAATNKVSPTERTGFVGFSAFLGQCWEIEAGFTCDRPADWITGGWGGGVSLSIILSEVVIGLSGGVPGLYGEPVEEQGLTAVILEYLGY